MNWTLAGYATSVLAIATGALQLAMFMCGHRSVLTLFSGIFSFTIGAIALNHNLAQMRNHK